MSWKKQKAVNSLLRDMWQNLNVFLKGYIVKKKTEAKTETKKPPKEKEKPKQTEEQKQEVKFMLPNKKPLILKSDGRVYGMTDAYGGMVSTPIKEQELHEQLTGTLGSKQPKPRFLLVHPPDKKWRVPLPFVQLWGQQLLAYDSEALCIYGVNIKDASKWIAIVPDQEVTSASVDVNEFGKARELMSKMSYRCVGTLHTHPGDMTSCSGTDTGELWNEFSGIHLIVTHTGKLSWWISSKEITWPLDQAEGFEILDLWPKVAIPKALKNTALLIGEDGTLDYDKFIQTKTFGFGYTGWAGKQHQTHQKSKAYRQRGLHVMYTGEWDWKYKDWIYEEQKPYQKVDKGYCQLWEGYFDKTCFHYYAGKPSKKMIRRHPGRYRIGENYLYPPSSKNGKKEGKNPSTPKLLPDKGRIPRLKQLGQKEDTANFSDIIDEGIQSGTEDAYERYCLNKLDADIAAFSTEYENFFYSVQQMLDSPEIVSPHLEQVLLQLLQLVPKTEKLIWNAKGSRTEADIKALLPLDWPRKEGE